MRRITSMARAATLAPPFYGVTSPSLDSAGVRFAHLPMEVAILFALILLNGVFAMSEIALKIGRASCRERVCLPV